ncbi:MAG: hypothetical protein HKP14_06005 [Bacteroidia bacterium]|nr:hypothetical protein [Bacteroidia bacterium]
MHPYVKKLNATAVDGKLFITWTTHAGFSCQDIHIELSTDSINFTRKGTYFGLCGDTAEKDYSYLIEDPFLNTTNYIRLELGNFGYSYVISEDVIYVENDVIIVPHPVTNESNMIFSNPLREEISASFYNRNGKLIYQISTKEDRISLAEIPKKHGIIVYYLVGEGNLIFRGRLFLE